MRAVNSGLTCQSPSSVLATPGTPSTSAWLRVSSVTSARRGFEREQCAFACGAPMVTGDGAVGGEHAILERSRQNIDQRVELHRVLRPEIALDALKRPSG